MIKDWWEVMEPVKHRCQSLWQDIHWTLPLKIIVKMWRWEARIDLAFQNDLEIVSILFSGKQDLTVLFVVQSHITIKIMSFSLKCITLFQSSKLHWQAPFFSSFLCLSWITCFVSKVVRLPVLPYFEQVFVTAMGMLVLCGHIYMQLINFI